MKSSTPFRKCVPGSAPVSRGVDPACVNLANLDGKVCRGGACCSRRNACGSEASPPSAVAAILDVSSTSNCARPPSRRASVARPVTAESVLTPELKAFIDRAIVPTLVKAYLAEAGNKNFLASGAAPSENDERTVGSSDGTI